MIGNKVNYIRAYTEVNCLLEYLPQSYIDKLPKKLMELIQNQSNEQYNINIDTSKSLLEQNFSKKTKDLIAVIKYNYWSTDEEKRQLKQIFYENEKNYQEMIYDKYNPDDIFKKRSEVTEEKHEEKSIEDVQITEYKETLFRKIINNILRFFRIK